MKQENNADDGNNADLFEQLFFQGVDSPFDQRRPIVPHQDFHALGEPFFKLF